MGVQLAVLVGLLSTMGPSTADHLELKGWIITDAATFPRTEAGFGRSWHTGLRLTSARLSLRFDPNAQWAARVDAELAGDLPELQEAWFEWGESKAIRVQVGRVRVPFGLASQLPQAAHRIPVMPVIVGNSKDFRDAGVRVEGVLFGKHIEYAGAVVSGSRDLAVDVNDKPDAVAKVRILFAPRSGRWVENLAVGASGSWGDGPTRHGFRARAAGGYSFVDPPTVRGVQKRAAGELEWRPPRLRLAAELIWIEQDRSALTTPQQIDGAYTDIDKLEPFRVWGGYAEVAWHIFGRAGPDTPANGLEVFGRFESLDFGDDPDGQGVSAASPKDHAPLPDGWMEGLTAGLNGYLGHGARVSMAWQGLRFADVRFTPDAQSEEEAGQSEWIHHVFVRAQWQR